ncbi:hypothetical protein BJI69_01410 [Luteibacter rhizovicinus DSM 16549]|uniref:Uncharacterized protein n=2 Tax=Luteibacter rhizovicinus TaxID=242606 RepID=A0A0G9H795_9GAMM|nr:hypothetical protein BJI69_01410 [Luteibacter rhizovicinus DSM 16549]KLD63587.1 hypothetical protein Y883_19140 [Luteibacter rhizovicinus DSM 16549]
MHSVRALLIAACLLAPVASASAANLPNMTLGEAGHADVIGQFVCGMPGFRIDAFRKQVNLLVPGGTGNASYIAGQQTGRDEIQKLRDNNDDLIELGQSSCPEIEALMNGVMRTTP